MRREQQKQRRTNLILLSVSCIVLIVLLFRSISSSDQSDPGLRSAFRNLGLSGAPSREHDCYGSEQGWPVFANKVEGVKYPFFISLADLGTPEKPNRNFARMSKGKLFQKPDISDTIQKVLEDENLRKSNGIVLDVGANVGMAAFAAAAMGYRVIAFEPVMENLNKLCDGVYLNRVGHLVKLFHAAVSDAPGSITLHKVIGRLDNSAVSLSGAKLAFKTNRVIPIQVATLALDSVITEGIHVSLLKVDVQGWEYHVLKGAQRLLSRPIGRAPYLIYEEDDKLLAESNSSSMKTLELLRTCGYSNCRKLGNDRHCAKL